MMDFPRKDNVRLENNKNSFKFQVLDWYIPEDDKSQKCINAENRKKGIPVEYPDEPSVYDIIMFGSTEEGHTVSVKVSDFEPYFYVKIPDKFACRQPLTGWVNDFYEYLIDTKYHDKKYGYERDIISKRYKDHLVSIKLVKKKEFYGFTNNRDFYFMKITVKSLGLFNSLRYFFKSPPEEFQKKYAYQRFEIYESGLTPFLRFIHLQNIKPCGWIELPAKSYSIISNSCDDDSYSKSNFHLETNYKYVKPYDSNRTAPILIASFDIECTSSHGDFPVAIKDYSKVVNDLYTIAKSGNFSKQTITEGLLNAYSKDVSICTETLHRIYAKSEPNEKQITKIIDKVISSMNDICNSSNRDSETYNKGVLLQLLNKNMPKLKGDSIIQIGTTVHRYGSPEVIYKSMISLKSCDDIDDVDVVCCKTEEELLLRWKDLMQRLSPDVLIGYNIFGFDFPYVWNRSKELGIDDYGVGFGRLSERNCQMLEQKLSSSALGDNIMYYIDADGIILIDVLKIMQKDHKLDSYKLDNVAKVFIGDKKNDLTPNEIFSKFRGNSYDRKVIAEYCIQDCCLVNHLFHKLKILENNIGMGNVCSVPLNYLFMRGQGIKIFSLVANECRKSNYLIPDLKGFREEDEGESGYEGAIVLIPNEGMYLDDYIVTLDFASLYPSSMIERNLSHDCYVNNPEYDNLPGIEYKTVEYDIYEGKGDAKHVVGKKSCKFVQLPNNEKGIIPRILQYLLKQRKVTRKKIEYNTLYTDNTTYSGILKSETDDKYKLYDIENDKYIDVLKSDVIKTEDTYDPFEKDVLDALQLAYKITANSLYGQIGARTSQIYLKEIAACTTATGRERILHAKEFVETEYGAEVIYGDTDSIFCKFKKVDENGNILKELEGLKFAIEQGKKASEDINKVLPYPQNLEYEKTFYPFIIFSKKRYVGNLYEEDPYKKPKQKSMGIVLKRRDNAPIVKKIYGGIIDILLNEKDLNKSVEFLDRELKRLINNEYPLEDLIISKTLKSTYVNPQSMAHKVLADRMGLRDPGNKPQVNDRIPFVYIKVPPEKEIKLQGDRVEHPDYIRENKLVPDYEFYITNQLLRPVAQLYTLCLEQLPNYDRDVNYWIDKAQELQEKKEIYKDENKLTNYMQTLKERDVERLLFSKYITKKVKKVSESSTKKITAIQKFNLDDNSLLLQFNIEEKKENKSKKFESVSICNNKEYVKTISCKSSTTKCNACTDLLNSILRDVIDDNKEKIETDGIRIEIKFSLYKNKLIKMLEEYDTFYEKFHKAQQSLDIGLVKEFQEMERTLIIPALLNSRKARYMII
jgi:DNA polymerase delta subunit 1